MKDNSEHQQAVAALTTPENAWAYAFQDWADKAQGRIDKHMMDAFKSGWDAALRRK